MDNTIVVRIDKSLAEVLEDVRRCIAIDLKTRYSLGEIEIRDNIASKVMAAKMRGKRYMQFRIRKLGLRKGVLEIL